MKIQYMSDLHFEFRENSRYIKHNGFPVTGDILVLAGDIFYLKDRAAPLGNFWEWASKNYRQVLIVPGNHEYYNYCDVMERGLQWRWMFKENVGYYQNQVLRIDDTDFIMSTLWSHIEPANEYFVWKGSVLNSAFASEYGDLIGNSRIDAWIYGHSHTNIDTEIGSTKVICNQMGYVFENEHIINGFDPGKFLTIENE